ncbi:hypothetical protein ACI8B_250070 [Acinetobacter proteolyticus]|uniref:Uncharacterized protein n=1 Tax=Acinetobacter proteolyticus TaxID=1776741 RepID=A0A653K560_9GAMM|nr:hypothetical protein ACI8B_250070 [Acinetobacter proteolyticus]
MSFNLRLRIHTILNKNTQLIFNKKNPLFRKYASKSKDLVEGFLFAIEI